MLVSYMIDAASKPRREFDAKPGGLLSYTASSGLLLAGFLSILWFVS
jgi:hypothetical protein